MLHIQLIGTFDGVRDGEDGLFGRRRDAELGCAASMSQRVRDEVLHDAPQRLPVGLHLLAQLPQVVDPSRSKSG